MNRNSAEAKPLVLLVPTELNPRSHGHACILELAKQLLDKGLDIFLLPYKPYTFFRHYFPRLQPKYRSLPFIPDIRELSHPILLAPESTPPKLIRRLRGHSSRMIWWLLAPAGLLSSFKPDIKESDYLVAFSDFVLPGQKDYLFVQPTADLDIEKSARTYKPMTPRRKQIAFYTGKGRLRPLPRSLHRKILGYQVVAITRAFPATRRSLVHLLEKSNGLISCDPLTNLSLEAALIGTPTLLLKNPFPQSSFTNFPANLTGFVTDSAPIFEERLSNRGAVRELSSQPLYQKSSQAAALVRNLVSPGGDQNLLVTDQTLEQINAYRKTLVRSRAIQAIREGQSMSSLFLKPYLFTLKTPYIYHLIFCSLLGIFDRLSEFINTIGLLRVLLLALEFLRPFYNMIIRLLRSAYSLVK
jgi:hypothetical protein